MNTLTIQQPSRLIQSLCLEGMPLKKQNKHQLDYLIDQALQRDKNLNGISTISSKKVSLKPARFNYTNIFLKYIAPTLFFEGVYNKLLSQLRHTIYDTAFANELVKNAMNCPILNAVKIPFQEIAFFSEDIFSNFDFDKLVCIISPVIEETLIRNLLQEQLLKRIPNVLLGKINKNYAEKIDKSLLVRISRVVISSLIFANYHNSSKPYVWIDCFFAGLLLGGLQEVTSSTLPSTITHIAHNTLEFFKIVNPLGHH